jgi:perosamine synthetase
MSEDIPLFRIDVGTPEVRNVVDSVTRGGFWAKGPYIDRFEAAIEEYIGVDHALVVNSGTTALVTALTAAGIEGGEVIVPSFTFIATANSVQLVGAEPVFADIERETYGLDPADVRDRITPETEAILPVHPYGSPCRIRELRAIADDHDLMLIEDGAAAFGATLDGDMTGTFGDISASSFCQNKVVTTGEGGVVLTDDDDLARRAKLFRSHGRCSGDYFESRGSGSYVSLGSNYRMSDPSAAIGAGQMERIDEIVKKRHAVGRYYTKALKSLETARPHPEIDRVKHVYQLFTVEFESTEIRDRVGDELESRGIDSKIYWDPPVHRTSYYDDLSQQLPVTEDIASRVLSLPMHPNLSEKQLDRIVDSVAAGLK